MAEVVEHIPMTRYRGSKRRFAATIAQDMQAQAPDRVVDPFGGSGTISAIADALGVDSRFNDLYLWSVKCARALFVHDYSTTELRDAQKTASTAMENRRPGFISKNFEGLYFTQDENLELDGLLQLQDRGIDEATADLIFYGLSQAALMKMPMSMFHRASLKQRLTNVDRKCGNLTTWNKPFHALVPRCMQEAASFTVRRRANHEVTQEDATNAYRHSRTGDVLFLDPPYVNPRGGVPTYDVAYHFLEGFAHGEKTWNENLQGIGRQPLFRRGKPSIFETKEGWSLGLAGLVRRARKQSVLATARKKDDPGAKAMEKVLSETFGVVVQKTLQKGVIFSKAPNPELLFQASA